MPEDMMGRLLPESIGPAIHLEKKALRETQLALQSRASSAAVALTASALVFACLPKRSSAFTDMLQEGGVWLAVVLCCVALGFWWRFLGACARLRGSGLRRPRGNRPRSVWAMAGMLTSVAVVATLFTVFGLEMRMWFSAGLPGLALAWWLGERLNQIPDAETANDEERRRLSLRQTDEDE